MITFIKQWSQTCAILFRILTVSVSYGFHNKTKLSGLKQQKCILSQARSLKLRCWQGHDPSNSSRAGAFLASCGPRQSLACAVLSLCLWVCMSLCLHDIFPFGSLFSLIRTLVILDWSPLTWIWPHLNSLHLQRSYFQRSSHSHILGVNSSTCLFFREMGKEHNSTQSLNYGS